MGDEKSTDDEKYKTFLQHLQNLPQNKKCVDCGKQNPDWASITLGFFICYECSGKHRKMGTKKSRVKSATLDRWSEPEIRRMYVGGNSNSYRFEGNPDVSIKYKNTEEYVRELDRRCEESADKEPGTSFMEKKERRVEVKRGSVSKRSVPRFMEGYKVERTEECKSECGEGEEKKEENRPVFQEEKREEKRDVQILGRNKKGGVKTRDGQLMARSPFSFVGKEDLKKDEEK